MPVTMCTVSSHCLRRNKHTLLKCDLIHDIIACAIKKCVKQLKTRTTKCLKGFQYAKAKLTILLDVSSIKITLKGLGLSGQVLSCIKSCQKRDLKK